MRLIIKLTILGLALSVLLTACNLPSRTPNAAATIQAVYTAQSGTVQALQTPSGASATPGSLPTITFPTLPPLTAVPTLTQRAAPPQPVTYCDSAAFVKDVTVPDGSIFAPGVQFTKTWRLQNIGTCSWTSAYALVFSSGNSMAGVTSVASFAGNVNPGQSVDVSINLSAPTVEGSYRGYWMLRNSAGVVFGLGGAASDPFYVDIKVVGGMTTVVDFSNGYCSAAWVSGAGSLECPGNTSSNRGYAVKLDNPQLENGQAYTGPGLLMVPENVNNGYVQGYYPPYTIQKGDRFRATLNCGYAANGCNVVFRLDYQIGSGQVQTLWQVNEAYEGQFYNIDSDLSALAGNQVKFILTVLANGAPNNDKALWAGARIDRPTNLFVPSATPTTTSTNLPPTATSTPTVTLPANTLTPTVTSTPTITSTP